MVFQDCPGGWGPVAKHQAPRQLPEGDASVVCALSSQPAGELVGGEGGGLTHTVHLIRQSVNKHQENTHCAWQALLQELQVERQTRLLEPRFPNQHPPSLLTRSAKAKNQGGKGNTLSASPVPGAALSTISFNPLSNLMGEALPLVVLSQSAQPQ